MTKAAKRRKKEEGEEFEIPAFDETAYMEKEVNAAKVSFTIIALAIPLALLLWAITAAGLWGVGFLLAIALTLLLPRVLAFLPWPKLDLARFERRDWIGHGGIFAFTWLAFWILLLNVPFADLTSPTIGSVTVNGVGVAAGVQNDVNVNNTNPVYVNATVFENVALQDVQLTVASTTLDMVHVSGPLYSVQLPSSSGAFDNITISATDTSGRSAEFVFDLVLT